MKREQFYTCNVNWNLILFDYRMCEYVNNRYILHMVQFERLWKPNLSVHVKVTKFPSIPSRWAKLAPTKSKWSRMVVWRWLKCSEAIMTPWHVWVCKIRWVGGSRWALNAPTVQKWAKNTPSAPNQPQFLKIRNGSTHVINECAHVEFDWAGALL